MYRTAGRWNPLNIATESKKKMFYLLSNRTSSLAEKEGFEISKRCKIEKMHVKECSVFKGLLVFL